MSKVAGSTRMHPALCRAESQPDCEHHSCAWGRDIDGCVLTDLRSSLLICRSSPTGATSGSQLTGWAVTQ